MSRIGRMPITVPAGVDVKLDGSTLTVSDSVESDDEVDILYPLHALSAPIADGNTVKIERGDAKLSIAPISNDLILDSISDKFDVDLNEGIDDEFKVEMPEQFHIYYKSSPNRHHEITVEFRISFID